MPPEISNLTKLRTLALPSTSVTSLPETLGKLTALTEACMCVHYVFVFFLFADIFFFLGLRVQWFSRF